MAYVQLILKPYDHVITPGFYHVFSQLPHNGKSFTKRQ